MTATDELRRMLDERGVEWKCYGYENHTWWGEWHAENRASVNGLFLKVEAVITPEQAIEATLGRGTCHNLAGQDEYGEWGFCCSECGARPKYDSGEVHIPSSGKLPDGTVWLGDSWVPWSYCPNCGRKVVDA